MANSSAQSMASQEQSDKHVAKQRMTRILYIHMFLNVSVLCLPIQARPIIVKQLTRGDAGAASLLLATLTSGVGLAEFFVNPIVGALSDAHGRLPFLLLSPLASLALKTALWRMLARGKGAISAASIARWLALERVVCGALTTVIYCIILYYIVLYCVMYRSRAPRCATQS